MPRQSPYDQQSLVLLESAQLDHGNYPSKEVTKELAELTNLSRKQVWDWFNKQRQAALPLDQRRPAMARRAREAKAAAKKKETEEDGEESGQGEDVGEVESGGDPDEEEDDEDVINWSEEDAAETAAAGAKRKKGPISKAKPKKLARMEVEDEEVEEENEEME